MSKKVVQDIVPPQKRKSIRDIPIPENRRKVSTRKKVASRTKKEAEPVVEEEVIEQEEVIEEKPLPKRRPVRIDEEFLDEPPRKNSGVKRKGLFFVIGIIILVIVFFLILSIRDIEVKVYPKEVTATVNSEISALNVANGSTSPLVFTTVEVNAESSMEVQATGEEEIVEKASGIITVSNEYTEEDQRLVKNTRFESPQGLIYRIPESIVVPGLTRDDEGDVIPGTIDVEVFADEAGKEYNVNNVRFTIPGFEGLPQFEGFYANTKTEISGGFDGVRKIVSDEDRSNAEEQLRSDIESQLETLSAESSGPGLVAFSNPSMQRYEFLDEDSSGDKVIIKMRGTSQVVIFEESQLSNAIASASINSFDASTERVLIDNFNELDVKVSADDSLATADVMVSGKPTFVWQTDLVRLANTLAGVELRDLKRGLDEFPSINKVEVSKKVFWRTKFSNDPSNIKITVVEE